MDHFNYRDSALHAEDVPLSRIAEAVGTPVYVYSSATLERHYRVFAEALSGLDAHIYYAMKANSNLAVLNTLAALGAGVDVVSEGELRRALAAGIPASKIVFSGVGKTRGELDFALRAGIHEINVESINELHLLNDVAGALGVTADIAIRVNPDVDAKTHEKISTGKKENKFGIDIDRAPEVFALAARLPNLNPITVACHIGSQLVDLAPYRAAFLKLAENASALRAAGIDIKRIDLGGGLGVPYKGEEPPSPAVYGDLVREVFGGLDYQLMFEPGRLIAANAGILLARVIFMKNGDERRFMILDAAMNDLIRPALYEGHHDLVPIVERPAGALEAPTDVVGPVCESGDTFAKGRALPDIADGELVAFKSAGAYGAVMASSYNSRLLPAEVLVRGDEFAVVRRRQTYEELIGADSLAPWQNGAVGQAAE